MNEFIFATLGLQAFPCGKSGERNLRFGGVPAHICAVGLYFMGCPVHSVPAQPHKTKTYSQEHQDETARKSSPQGVTIPNANATRLLKKNKTASPTYSVAFPN